MVKAGLMIAAAVALAAAPEAWAAAPEAWAAPGLMAYCEPGEAGKAQQSWAAELEGAGPEPWAAPEPLAAASGPSDAAAAAVPEPWAAAGLMTYCEPGGAGKAQQSWAAELCAGSLAWLRLQPVL